jgi:uncharacterized protein (TIGR02996 family)
VQAATRIEVRHTDGTVNAFELRANEITFGRVQGNDIVLPRGNISKRHARLVLRDDKYILVDLKSTNGTYVNGRKITSPIVLKAEDKIHIGDFSIVIDPKGGDWELEPTLEVDATELRLLAGIAQRDEASRLVYADWLEGNGHVARAEFLRTQEQLVHTPPDDGGFRVLSDKLRHLAAEIDVQWRFKVARPLVENCLAVEFECPRDWGSLATTEFSDIRYCGACSKRVYYCNTIDEARKQAGRGNCVAVDIVQLRRPGDLDPETERHMVMGAMMPYRP